MPNRSGCAIITAEQYLVNRYGAYRGHYEWRALEEAFNAGKNASKPSNTIPILIDYIALAPAKPRARRSDPETSHDAANRVDASKAKLQRNYIKHFIEVYGPSTVDDMAVASSFLKHELLKRIGEVLGIAPTGEKRGGFRVWGLIE